MSTYYDILRVSEDADDKEIKAAYKQAAVAYHPDQIPKGVSKRMRDDAAQTWLEIQEAFAVLSDRAKREEYDSLLEEMRQAEELERQFEPQAPPPAPPQPKPSGNPVPENQTPPEPTPPPPTPKKQSFWGPSSTRFGSITLITGGIGCLLFLGGFGESQTTILPGLALVSLSFGLLCWRHGMRPGTDPKVLGGSVFLFIFAVMFFAGWIESPSPNSKQINPAASQARSTSSTLLASPAPTATVPCKRVTAGACVGTATPNKLGDTGPATKRSERLNPQIPTQSSPITATAKGPARQGISPSMDTSSSAARAAYFVLRTGIRIHVTDYHLLGDKYRLQLVGGWTDVNTSDVVSIQPEPSTKQTATSVSRTWKNLRDGQLYRTHVDGDSLYLESTDAYPHRTGNIANCKFHRAITAGLSWAGECWEINPKDQSIYRSDATITTLSETQIEMGTGDMTAFAMIPADAPGHPSSITPSGAENKVPASRGEPEKAPPTPKTAPRPDLAGLSYLERQSIESACSYDKNINGPAAYYTCLENQLGALARISWRPDFSSLTNLERQSLESACSYDKNINGPAAYYRCLEKQFRSLAVAPRQPDLSNLTSLERQSIESACSYDKNINGPAAYYRCVQAQRELLKKRR